MRFRHYQRWLLSAACGLALLATATLKAADPQVLPATGEPYTAAFKSATAESLQFTVAGEPRSLPIEDLVRYGAFIEPRHGPLWLLVDGGALVADAVRLDKERLQGDSLLFGDVSLPFGAVAGIALRLPGDKGRRDALLKTISAAAGDHDRIVLDNGDELTGVIESLGGERVAIATATGRIEVELLQVAAIVFNPSLAEKPSHADPYLVVGFTDGSRLVANSFTADAESLNLSAWGENYSARPQSLSALQVFGGRATDLSDLKELSFKHVPYLQLGWPLRKDANVLGQPLRAGGKRYLKGLGMHTAARVAYRLDGPYQEFQAELAIDDSAGNRGSAVCSVFVDDGTGKWQSRYTSPIIRGSEPPIAVRVDLTGVKAISLLADFADHGDQRDHVDWLGARLIR